MNFPKSICKGKWIESAETLDEDVNLSFILIVYLCACIFFFNNKHKKHFYNILKSLKIILTITELLQKSEIKTLYIYIF